MKVLVHFEPPKSDFGFEGTRLRKTLKGACEAADITWVDTLLARPDIAHFLSAEDLPLLEKAKKEGVKTILSAGYTETDPKASFYTYRRGRKPVLKAKAKKMIGKADLVLVPDENTKKRFLENGAVGNFLITPAAVHLARFEAASPIEKNIFRHYARVKNEDRYVLSTVHFDDKGMIDIYKKIAALRPEYKFFVLIGKPRSFLGWMAVRRYQRKATKNLIFSPLIEDDVFRSALMNASCFLKIGSYYSGDIQILEAFAAKTPVIAYGEQENSPLLQDGVNCDFATTPKEAADSLIEIWKEPDKDMLAEAYRIAKANSLPNFGKRLKQIYEDLLNPKEENQHA